MINICFKKERGEHYAEAIAKGADIKAPPEGWSANEILSLAGCLFAAIFSQGPQLHRELGHDVASRHGEAQEFITLQLRRDIHSAIEFCQQLSFAVMDNQYNEKFGPIVRALIEAKDTGPASLNPVEGFKEGWQS